MFTEIKMSSKVAPRASIGACSRVVALLLVLLMPLSGLADSTTPASTIPNQAEQMAEQLAMRLASQDFYAAEFSQRVDDIDGTLIDEYQGRVAIARPAKLRWDVDAPLEQSIVLENNRLQQYDRDLDQLTLRDLEPDAIALPKVLLQGNAAAIEQSFTVEEQSSEGAGVGVAYRLQPKKNTAQFVSLSVSFADEQLASLSIVDELHQITTITFYNVTTAPVPDERFELDIPADTEIIGP